MSKLQDQKLTNIYKNQTKRVCSLEFSSKKDIDYNAVDSLPMSFCSIIWIGNYDNKAPHEIEPLKVAGELVKRGHPVLLHFASRNNNKKSVVRNLDYAKQVGVRNLLVMRGASPECQQDVSAYDFPFSTDLIKFIKGRYGDYFDLCVPGYPYMHPESKTLEEDMKFLKQKEDAGASFIMTQATFSYDVYREFLDNCRKYGVKMQIIPGCYIIHSAVDFKLLKKLCKIPDTDPAIQFVKEHFGNEDKVAEYGIKLSTEIIKSILLDRDFCPPHIYTMNEYEMVKNVLLKLKDK